MPQWRVNIILFYPELYVNGGHDKREHKQIHFTAAWRTEWTMRQAYIPRRRKPACLPFRNSRGFSLSTGHQYATNKLHHLRAFFSVDFLNRMNIQACRKAEYWDRL